MTQRLLPVVGAASLCVLVVLLSSVATASAQVTTYGSGVNPPGSLVVLTGVPEVGITLTLGVANTAVVNPGPSLAFLILATAPAAGYPAGVVLPGFGLAGPGTPGELLLNAAPPDPLVTLGPVFSTGVEGMPAPFGLPIPAIPTLMGLSVYAQGGIVALAQGNAIGLTQGLKIQVQAAVPDPSKFALIRAGTFRMGSNAASGSPYFGQSNHKPVHQVTISKPFWMGRYEVTQADYQALMGTNPSAFVGADRPVEFVSWFNAVAYCDALNAQQSALGKVPLGYEYACRAGTTTEFHHGDALLCNQARFSYSYHSNSSCGVISSSGTVPVGSYLPNAFGLYDMHGNVWEWCMDGSDGFSGYTASAKTDPYVSGGPLRVLRGGSWIYNSGICRSAYRGRDFPGSTFNSFGFRVVLAPVLLP